MTIVVIGGGISGISAAKVLLKAGHKVIILEQTDAPGGLMEKIANCRVGFKTFFAEIESLPALEVITGSRIVDVDKLYEKSLITLDSGRLIEADGVIIAAGLAPYEPKERTGKRILASLDYDRLIDQRNESLPGDLRKVAFVLCVGSRCSDYPLCSAMCCSYTLREIKWTFQRGITPQITVFYNDLRFFGQEFYLEKLYRDMGVSFVRANSRYFEEDDDGVTLRYFNGGHLSEERFDYVVLATGLRPGAHLPELSQYFGFSLNEWGFVKESAPLATDSKGVYVSGGSLEPMSIKDAILTGYGAAVRCMMELDDGRRVPVMTAHREVTPEVHVKAKSDSYLFYLGTGDPLLRMFYEFFAEKFLVEALKLKKKRKDVIFVTRNLVTPSYTELLYEEARREGIVFIHLEEDERIDTYENGARIDGPKGETNIAAATVVTLEQYAELVRDREFLIQYRSEPQLRWSPTKWDRERYHAGFIRFPRSARWEEREALGALGEFLIEKDAERTLPDIDEERCSGCGSCGDSCPAKAISVELKEKQISIFGPLGSSAVPVATVKKELCLGCGLCASTCPSDVIGFKEAS